MLDQSFWHTGGGETYPALRGRRSADAVVIGGGLSGLMTSLWLAKAGLRVALLEAERLGCGASSRCAGVACLADGYAFSRLEQRRGAAAAEALARTQQSAFAALRELCRTLPCSWQDADAQLVTEAGEKRLQAEAAAMRRAGIEARVSPPTRCPLPAQAAIPLRDMGALDPAALMRAVCGKAVELGLKVFEKSRVTALETNIAYTERGSVLAPYLIVATGYPIVNTPGWYFVKLKQRWRYLARIRGGETLDGVCVDMDGRYTLRGLRDGALLQMAGRDVGESAGEDGRDLFLTRYAPFFPSGTLEDVRAGAEVETPDGLPCVGAYSPKTPNLFAACGYGGRGLVGSVLAAQAISATVLGLPVESYAVYAGDRFALKQNARQALAMAGRYAASQLHVAAPRCPHMGCKLKYQREARLWECPCHGSRFDDIGHVVAAPAVEDAQIKRGR